MARMELDGRVCRRLCKGVDGGPVQADVPSGDSDFSLPLKRGRSGGVPAAERALLLAVVDHAERLRRTVQSIPRDRLAMLVAGQNTLER